MGQRQSVGDQFLRHSYTVQCHPTTTTHTHKTRAMKSIVKLAVFIAVLYSVFQYGKPHLERLTGTLGINELPGASSDAAHCVGTAERTTETFADVVVRRARPPVDINRWSGSYRLAEGRLNDAELACQCPGEACELGQQALSLLAEHMTRWDESVHNKEPVLNGARRLGRIYDLLNTAKRKL